MQRREATISSPTEEKIVFSLTKVLWYFALPILPKNIPLCYVLNSKTWFILPSTFHTQNKSIVHRTKELSCIHLWHLLSFCIVSVLIPFTTHPTSSPSLGFNFFVLILFTSKDGIFNDYSFDFGIKRPDHGSHHGSQSSAQRTEGKARKYGCKRKAKTKNTLFGRARLYRWRQNMVGLHNLIFFFSLSLHHFIRNWVTLANSKM